MSYLNIAEFLRDARQVTVSIAVRIPGTRRAGVGLLKIRDTPATNAMWDIYLIAVNINSLWDLIKKFNPF